MRMVDLIAKKRNGKSLSAEEITQMIHEYVEGSIPDYQMSAFLMAVYFQGMTEEETLAMTNAVAHSGDMVDLSAIDGIKVDKHSTGGVGDKTTLIIGPMVAACGVKVAKMSGRGLGHTGGTVDKMESIPGMQTGLCVIGQSGNITPADKKLYALRDVTATVDSIPLIAVSIMGKKLAAGSDCILLDVKTGSGAFMKTVEDSIALAKEMVAIGENAGKKTVALITNMDIPLGNNIGNSLEVIEAVETLKGNGPADLTHESINLAGNMLYLAGKGTLEECRKMAETTIQDGSAFNCLIAMVEAQGGDSSVIKDCSRFQQAPFSQEVLATESGYVVSMDTEKCGIASAMLGAGRETKESEIDYSAGIILHKKTGDYVEQGTSLATLYTSKVELFENAMKTFSSGIELSSKKPEEEPLIYARVTREQVERYS